ncbi:hypothetical protein SA496_25935 [Pseudomonas sp. JS3066]|jgi:hypothetical protein|uniref:hypothetical protein n=1 Tax=unclassified Pseudomonas TaxID=196821 RepID=UPI002E7AC810|nr:hypothetical protein [Pseudomonas sp. JS3066]WVK93109.1 hypothetical protein SA496_25935 [Pseudomonas sp. JS3066]
MKEGEWLNKIKMLFTSRNCHPLGMNLVDNHGLTRLLSLGKTRCTTTLWVKGHSIPSFYTTTTQPGHVFSTRLLACSSTGRMGRPQGFPQESRSTVSKNTTKLS